MNALDTPGSSTRTGLAQGVGAYFIWGFLPLYFLLLRNVGAGEVVADRIIWSLVLLAAVILAAGRMAHLRAALASRRVMAALLASSALISVNWLVYIWAVQNQHVLEGSLGYFLNPLVNVVLGVVVLKERLTRVQGVAVALACAGVAVLAANAVAGLWISLTLALSFGTYGLVRKIAPVDALEGLTLETALLSPIALAYCGWLWSAGTLRFGVETGETIYLILSGAVTAVPLLLFAAAAKRLPYATLGLLQYLAPSIQFILAVTVLGEPFTTAHLICFALIWSGLALYAGSGLRDSLRLRGTRAVAE